MNGQDGTSSAPVGSLHPLAQQSDDVTQTKSAQVVRGDVSGQSGHSQKVNSGPGSGMSGPGSGISQPKHSQVHSGPGSGISQPKSGEPSSLHSQRDASGRVLAGEPSSALSGHAETHGDGTSLAQTYRDATGRNIDSQSLFPESHS